MKLLMSVFVIRFIMALFENKTNKNKNQMQHDAHEHETKHPAEFQVR